MVIGIYDPKHTINGVWIVDMNVSNPSVVNWGLSKNPICFRVHYEPPFIYYLTHLEALCDRPDFHK